MQKTAQVGQEKSGGVKVYAFEVARINAETVSLKLRMQGGASSILRISAAEMPNILSQIDSALAETAGEIEINFGSGICAISPKLLKQLKNSLSPYCAVPGGSGAQADRGSVSTPTKTKAPARAERSAARQFKEEPGRDSGIAKQSRKGQSPFNGSGTAAARAAKDAELDGTAHTALSADFESQVARALGEELRRAVMPILAEIDAIAALLKETAAEMGAFKSGDAAGAAALPARKERAAAPISRNSGVADPLRRSREVRCNAREAPFSCPPRVKTRRGRTSVAVGRRKAS